MPRTHPDDEPRDETASPKPAPPHPQHSHQPPGQAAESTPKKQNADTEEH